jgi:hypothetical protein
MALVGPLSFHYLKPCAIVALVLAVLDVALFLAAPTALPDVPLLAIAMVVLCLGILIP